MSTSEDVAVAALALARRFAAGATMWCVAPEWAEHARHVAVEFVHPVIVGKRALPAVTVDAADPVGRLRALGASGDVLVVLGDADTPGAPDCCGGPTAWGLTTVWIGAGAPTAGRRGRPRALGRRPPGGRRPGTTGRSCGCTTCCGS